MTSYVILGFYYVLCQFPSCEQVNWTTLVYILNIQGEFKACGYFQNQKTEEELQPIGDCRAVLSRRGKAIEMSRDHRPGCTKKRIRIEASGGFIDDGYLNGAAYVKMDQIFNAQGFQTCFTLSGRWWWYGYSV